MIRLFSILVLCFFTVINCDSSSKTKKTTVKTLPTPKKNAKKKDTTPTPKNTRKHPVLTSKNVMDFFLEYDKKHKENKVRITTDFGTIDIELFEKTKFHRANFIFLTKQNYFNGAQFHRVVNNFIIQGGNSDERFLFERRKKIGRYLLPPDTKRGYKHYRGMISMPSSEIENAYKLASPYEFFIVQKDAHHLNGAYTIFGKVTKGMAVVDKIAAAKTDGREWPLNNIYIKKVEIIK